MTRLTYRDEKVYGGYSAVETDEFACVGKLGKLEDIEEELGIDLITLFKALKDGMWFKHYDEYWDTTRIWNTDFYMKPLLNVYSKSIEIKEYVDDKVGGYCYVDRDVVYLKDYGKTWALTKEELENESNSSL